MLIINKELYTIFNEVNSIIEVIKMRLIILTTSITIYNYIHLPLITYELTLKTLNIFIYNNHLLGQMSGGYLQM